MRKLEEITGDWRMIYNEGLRTLHFSSHIIGKFRSSRKMRTRHVACIRKKRNAYKNYNGNS
jgi:hypothetical protein